MGRNFVPVICGNLYPDHSTCAAFVRRHAAAVAGLLPESVRACAREGLVSLEVTAGDGTKLKANASMASNVTAGQLQAQIAEPEAFIGAGVEAWIAQILDAGPDAPAPAPAGTDRTGGTTRKMPKRARQTLERRKAARAQLDARQAPAQESPKPAGPPPTWLNCRNGATSDRSENGSRNSSRLTCGNRSVCERSVAVSRETVRCGLVKKRKCLLTCVRALPGIRLTTSALATYSAAESDSAVSSSDDDSPRGRKSLMVPKNRNRDESSWSPSR